ncbi:hypothetical protein GGX14DRAFT_700975 [Mycena pura]|uniref:Uncharacterized protein n=1 Tax=Mycena pura TaxID=153505 RepID=A0AAD6Y4S1_9AGAR|nr:hypothetical protein GGX14DRAFT_700975 [Mycena pura]
MSFAAARYLRRPSPVRLRPPTPAPPQPPAVHPILQSLTPLPPLPTAQLTAPPAACAPSLTCADRRCSRCLRRPPPVCARWRRRRRRRDGHDATGSHGRGSDWLAEFTQYNPVLDFSATFACVCYLPPPFFTFHSYFVSVNAEAACEGRYLAGLAAEICHGLRVVDVAQPASPPPRFRHPVQPPPRARSFSTRRFTALQRPAPPTHACEGSFLAARALRVGYYRDVACGSPLLVAARWRIWAPTACTAPGRPPPFARGCISQDPPPYRTRNLQNTSPDRSLNQEFIYGCSMSALASTAPHARVDYTCPPFNCRASLSARRVVGGISTLHCVTARDWALFTSQYNSVMLSFSFVFHLRHATATHLGPPGLDSMHSYPERTTLPAARHFTLTVARTPIATRRLLHTRARAPSRRLCRKASRVRGRDHSPPRVLRTNWTFVDVGRTRRGVGRRMKEPAHAPRS